MKRMHVKAGNHSEAILFPDCKSRLALKRLAKKNVSLFFSCQLCRGPCLYSFCSSVSSISLSTVSKSGMFFFPPYACPALQPSVHPPLPPWSFAPVSFCGSASLSLHCLSKMCHANSSAVKNKTRAPLPLNIFELLRFLNIQN